MTVFGDHEPADSWDALDAPAVQVLNLGRRLAAIDALPAPAPATDLRGELVRLEGRVAAAARRSDLTGAQLRRLAGVALDLIYVRARL